MELIMNFIENGPSADLFQRDSDLLLICYDKDHNVVSETAYTDIDTAAAAGEAWKITWRE